MRWIVAIILVIAVAGLIFLFRQKSTPDLAASYHYAIKDVTRVAKIKIDYRLIDPDILLERKNGFWQLNGVYRAREDAMVNLLKALERLELQFIPRPAGKTTMLLDLATTGTKVEIFAENGELLKSYFIGGSTPDERGTFMIMAGTYDPAVVSMAGFEGTIRPIFIMSEIDWRDRIVFREDPDHIQELVVEYPGQPEASFILRRMQHELAAYPFKDDVKSLGLKPKPGAIESYLMNYKSVGAEAILSIPNLQEQLLREDPFVRISVRRSDASSFNVQLFPIKKDPEGSVRQQIARYHLMDDQGAVYLVQHRVFEKLFLGRDFFFENVSN